MKLKKCGWICLKCFKYNKSKKFSGIGKPQYFMKNKFAPCGCFTWDNHIDNRKNWKQVYYKDGE